MMQRQQPKPTSLPAYDDEEQDGGSMPIRRRNRPTAGLAGLLRSLGEEAPGEAKQARKPGRPFKGPYEKMQARKPGRPFKVPDEKKRHALAKIRELQADARAQVKKEWGLNRDARARGPTRQNRRGPKPKPRTTPVPAIVVSQAAATECDVAPVGGASCEVPPAEANTSSTQASTRSPQSDWSPPHDRLEPSIRNLVDMFEEEALAEAARGGWDVPPSWFEVATPGDGILPWSSSSD